MKKQWTAWLLVLAALCSLVMVPVFADEEAAPPILIAPAPVEDGVLSFDELHGRMLGGYYPLLALEENVISLETLDYEAVRESLQDGIEELVSAIWGIRSGMAAMGSAPLIGSYLSPLGNLVGEMATAGMQQQYESLRDMLDDLKSGQMQKDNADIVWQLRHTENSVVKMGETIYITLLGLEESATALDRQEAALARTLEELQLRYNLGQISALTLQEAEAGMTQLQSGKATLLMNMEQLYAQLSAMVGEEVTERLSLTALPEVTAQMLAEMDVERDLGLAKEASYDLYSAMKTLEDAEETYLEAEDDYDEDDYQLKQAKHTWQSAQYTYNAAVQNFELAFRKTYAQVHDCAQILEACKVMLETERAKLDVAEVKFAQGNLARNKLLEAQEAVYTAQDKVNTAARDLFSAYNNSNWAVESGLLES